MKITDRNLFGAYLHSISNSDNIISIREITGETTIGEVVGYTRGGYQVNGTLEIQVPTVQIKTYNWLQYNIKIENIVEITDEFNIEFRKGFIPGDFYGRIFYYMTINGNAEPTFFNPHEEEDCVREKLIELLKERYKIDYTGEIEFNW